jgi:hypothetical protein|tara:strand:+ start:280 stop:489 length:210 start_codon:yes stop_codon:yes gene_type:complete
MMYGKMKREKKTYGGKMKKDGNAAARREPMMDGGMQKAARTKANMGRMMYNKGGQPEYKSGDMPKAKPC